MLFTLSTAQTTYAATNPASLYQPAGFTATCNGTVFRDDSGDGTYDASEIPVAAVRLEIYDDGETLLGEAITDSNGNWSVSNLPVGTAVRVQVKTPLPGGLIEGPVGTNSDGFVVFTNTDSCSNITFGALLISACSNLCVEVGNRVWYDENPDGLQNANEVGIAGVTVRIYDDADQLVAQKTTDADGHYIFTCQDGLEANATYDIRLDNAADFTTGPLVDTFLTNAFQGSDPQVDSVGTANGDGDPEYTVTLGDPGQSIHYVDFGFTPPATIGDTVWYDINGNGTQDTYTLTHSSAFDNFGGVDFSAMLPVSQTNVAETGIPSVTVWLYGPGVDTVVGTGDDVLMDTQVTDALGQYRFRPLQPGIPYLVRLDDATLPSNMSASYDEDGAGDHQIVVNALSAGEQHLTADFGYTGAVDLGITKVADYPDFRPRDSIVWTVTVTNYGAIPAPNVVVADAMGGQWDNDSDMDTILGRIFDLYWDYTANGSFNPAGNVETLAEVEALIDTWIQANVSVSGTPDWTCSFDYTLTMPFGYPIDPSFYNAVGEGGFAEVLYGKWRRPLQDIQLTYFCSLNQDLAPGATAAPIVFTIGNEFNIINHEFETLGLPETALLGEWDQIPQLLGNSSETNYALTESHYGAEPFGTYPNTDSATIDHIGDLQWDKTLVNIGDAPFDIGEDMEWLITVTNVGSLPWYDDIIMYDEVSYAYITGIPSAPWTCDPLQPATDPTQKDSNITCLYPRITGGLGVGQSVVATITTQMNSSPGQTGPTDNPGNLVNAVAPLYNTALDDNTANNKDTVPYTTLSTAWIVSKGSPTIVDGNMEWTINNNVTVASIPAGQFFVIEERLPAGMSLLSVESADWYCEDKDPEYANTCDDRCSQINYQVCWYEPPVTPPTNVPSLVIQTDYLDGASNTACPGRGIRYGPNDWNFGVNSGPCESSPIYNGVPIAPTDMAIIKTHDVSTEPWIRGGTGTFTLTIAELNVGPDRPVVEDILQPGMSFVDVRNSKGQSVIDAQGDPVASTGWSCTTNITTTDLRVFDRNTVGLNGGMLQCIGDRTLNNATDYLYIDVAVTTDAGDFVHNDAAIEGLTRAEPKKTTNNLPHWVIGDPGTIDNDTEDEVPVPSPDLQISKTHVAPVFAGVSFDFTINVTNNNDFSAIETPTNTVPYEAPLPLPVRITDTFPVGLSYEGYSGTDWTCASDNAVPPVITCSYGITGTSLAAGSSASPLKIQAIAPSTAIAQTNNAVAVWTDQSPIIFYSATPDNATDEVTINIPFVEATKTASQPQTIAGDAVTDTFDFYLAVENTQGTGAALAPVRITDTMPTAFNINSINAGSDWDCGASIGQIIDCTYEAGTGSAVNMPLGTSTSVTVHVTTDADASAGTITNTMYASHGGIQALPEELTSSRPMNVLRYANLTVEKNRDIAEPNPGDIVAYTVVVTNTGPSKAQSVQVLDYVPYGATYVDNAGSDGAWNCVSDGGNPELVTCSLTGDLAVGNTPTLILRMMLTANAFPGVSNFITVQSTTATTPDFTGQPYALDEYAAATGCIGDYVWLDTNGDGVEDGSTAGDDGLFDTLDDVFGVIGPGLDGKMSTADDSTHGFENVDLSLYWSGPDDLFGTADDVDMGTTRTDNTGYYAFQFIPAGYYTLTVDTDTGTFPYDNSSLRDYYATYDVDSGTVNPDSRVAITVGDTISTFVRTDVDFGYQPTPVSSPSVEVSKVRNTPDPVLPGTTISFTIRITNTGSVTITNLPLTDTYQSAYLTYLRATPSSNSTGDTGQVLWTDLTASGANGFGADLGPGQSFSVDVFFVTALDTSSLPNTATINTAIVFTATATDTVRIYNATSILIADHHVDTTDDRVALHWTTLDESDISGFHIERINQATGASVPLTKDNMFITSQFAGQTQGTAYAYLDTTAEAGIIYRYVLHMMATDGSMMVAELGTARVGGWMVYLPVVTVRQQGAVNASMHMGNQNPLGLVNTTYLPLLRK
ncbi:MAG: SdrD B-like domain-containing protein [Chloroflexota bacterium]